MQTSNSTRLERILTNLKCKIRLIPWWLRYPLVDTVQCESLRADLFRLEPMPCGHHEYAIEICSGNHFVTMMHSTDIDEQCLRLLLESNSAILRLEDAVEEF